MLKTILVGNAKQLPVRGQADLGMNWFPSVPMKWEKSAEGPVRVVGQTYGSRVGKAVKVLVCGASSGRLEEMTSFLAAFQYDAVTARSPRRALEIAQESHAQIAIWLETETTAWRGLMLDAAKSFHDVCAGAESIVIGPADEPEYAAAAFRAGVYNCMSWPVDYANLARDLEFLEMEALRRRELWSWSGALGGERPITFAGLTGASARMVELYEQLGHLALNNDPVLITGPVGSGKEMAAVALHALMEKAACGQPYHPLMIYRCCGLTDEKAEELFAPDGILGALSHDAGPDPEGAPDRQPSAVDLLGFTRPGALLIDEISDLPASAQHRLATWLLGSKAALRRYPVRVMASTRCDLNELAEQGSFHPGLLRLLNRQAVAVPALGERSADIPMLVEEFMSSYVKDLAAGDQGAELNKLAALDLSRDAQRALLLHDWPGNVRELKNVVNRAAMTAKHQRIEASDLGLPAPPYPPVRVLDWHELDGVDRNVRLKQGRAETDR